MKNCPNCNSIVPDVAKFCPKCRFNIKKYEDGQVNSVSYCMECGAVIQMGASFCMECGATIVSANTTSNFANTQNAPSVTSSKLFESEGFNVEKGVLVGYTGKKRSVTIYGSINEIYDGAFKGNYTITYVDIQEGVEIIGREAFASCSSLVEISIPSTCRKICENAFSGVKLETLILTGFDKDILFAFVSEKVKKYLTEADIKQFVKTRNSKLVFDIKSIENFVETKCKIEEDNKIEKERIAKEKTKASDEFFIENGVLKKYNGKEVNVTIPNTVIKIGECAFKDCNKLIRIDIPNSVEAIGDQAFEGCTRLTDIEIPDSVTSIGESAFKNCSSIESIEIPCNVIAIEDCMFEGCTRLTDVEIPEDSIVTIGELAFSDCTSLTYIEIPDSVKTICAQAFYGCTSLESVVMPNSITSVGEEAFYGCTSLKSVDLSDGIMSIESCTFYDCESLTSVEIPEGIKNICDSAFYGCENLKYVEIPSSLESIGDHAFGGTRVKKIKAPKGCYISRYWNNSI